MVTQETLVQRAGIARSSVAVYVSNLMKKGHIIGKGYILPEVGYVAVVGAVNVDGQIDAKEIPIKRRRTPSNLQLASVCVLLFKILFTQPGQKVFRQLQLFALHRPQ